MNEKEIKEVIIPAKLAEIEKKENVHIIYCVESGSRAWGIASPDSDFDVRFIYVRPKDYYLCLDKTRDVIEWQLDETLDINGWDLPSLFTTKGNAFLAVLTDRFSINEIIGKTVIIHSAPDDFRTQPAGNSRSKIACGEIRVYN